MRRRIGYVKLLLALTTAGLQAWGLAMEAVWTLCSRLGHAGLPATRHAEALWVCHARRGSPPDAVSGALVAEAPGSSAVKAPTMGGFCATSRSHVATHASSAVVGLDEGGSIGIR